MEALKVENQKNNVHMTQSRGIIVSQMTDLLTNTNRSVIRQIDPWIHLSTTPSATFLHAVVLSKLTAALWNA